MQSIKDFARRRLTVRVYERVTPYEQWSGKPISSRDRERANDCLRLGGLKAFIDGSLGSTTALFFEPFTDRAGTAGLLADATSRRHAQKEHQGCRQSGASMFDPCDRRQKANNLT